jgi:hypothetical protein
VIHGYSRGCPFCGQGITQHTSCPSSTPFFERTIPCDWSRQQPSFGITVDPLPEFKLDRPKNNPYYRDFDKRRVPKVIKK